MQKETKLSFSIIQSFVKNRKKTRTRRYENGRVEQTGGVGIKHLLLINVKENEA